MSLTIIQAWTDTRTFTVPKAMWQNDKRTKHHSGLQRYARIKRAKIKRLFPAFEAEAMAAMIEQEPVGEDNVPDLILLNYKGADFVGHKHGPDANELRVTLGEMDRQLARVLSVLRAKVGNNYLLAVTADHGMPPEPPSPDRRHFAPAIVACSTRSLIRRQST